ncbi:MAG: hypothetical protein IJR16_07610 [Spirochaetales bacterium]|nr:hypothetical protein [Spirochaetales bacterium]
MFYDSSKKEDPGYFFWQNVDKKRGNVSLAEIARVKGLKYQRLKEQRSDNTLPRVDYAIAIADAVGTTCEFLMTGSDSRPETPGDRLYRALLEQAPAVLQGLIETYIEKRDISSAPRMA